jgi:very-short-patch-repair endonuclease
LGEILLWKELNNKQFYGHDFHRQKPLLNYIVDFYCYELNLVIEIDGKYHNYEEQNTLDILRDNELQSFGLTIIRFTENEVRHDMINVIRTLEDHYLTFIEQQEEHTPPPLSRGESHRPAL